MGLHVLALTLVDIKFARKSMQPFTVWPPNPSQRKLCDVHLLPVALNFFFFSTCAYLWGLNLQIRSATALNDNGPNLKTRVIYKITVWLSTLIKMTYHISFRYVKPWLNIIHWANKEKLSSVGNKGPKHVRSTVRNRLKFGKISRHVISCLHKVFIVISKTYCVRKCNKKEYREFDHRGTLKRNNKT